MTRTFLLAMLALAAGCAARGQVDVLESRLRQQEDTIASLQARLSASESQLQAARREAIDAKTQLGSRAKTARVEQLSALGQVQGVSLNKFLTGGYDRDGVPGDEILSAVVVPNDADGNLVKVPGTITVTVLDLSKPEAEQRVGRWEFSPKESEALWHSGLFGSGYVVRVPWQTPPQSPSLLVHARLTTVDVRQFDTSQAIRIGLPGAPIAGTANVAAAPDEPPPAEPAKANEAAF